MEKFLLSLHVVTAIVLVGPMTVAVVAFPRSARTASRDGAVVVEPSVSSSASVSSPHRAAALAGVLHRATRVFTVLALKVPVAGIALAGLMGVLGDAWVLVSLALTVAAAALLAAVVLPEQNRIMSELDSGRDDAVGTAGLRAAAPALFALIWVVVVVLMIVRPGSTTGV